MKKFLFTALLAGFACAACNEKPAAATEAEEVQSVSGSDLAYVNPEYVLAQSDLFQTEGKALQEKTEKAQQSWAKKQQEALQRRAAYLESSVQKEGQTLEEENFVFTNRGRDLLLRAVKEVNADGRYRMVVNTSALIDADSTLDISDAVLKVVNKLYAAEKEGK